MKRSAAEVLREYTFPGVEHLHGVSYDGRQVWFASAQGLKSFDPASGMALQTFDVAAHAGQRSTDSISFRSQRTASRRSIRRPDKSSPPFRHPAGAATRGKIMRTIESNRFVTGVTWVDGELWHGTLEEGESDLRRVDPHTGKVLEKVDMPAGVQVSGLESDGGDRFFCGGATSGKVRAIRRPRRG